MSPLTIGLWIVSVLLIVWALRSIAIAVRRVADVLYQAALPNAGVLERPLGPADRYDPDALE